jgi:hypothetical protein
VKNKMHGWMVCVCGPDRRFVCFCVLYAVTVCNLRLCFDTEANCLAN